MPEQYPLQSTPWLMSPWRAARLCSSESSTAKGFSMLTGAATTADLTAVASARAAVVIRVVECMLLVSLRGGWCLYDCGVRIVKMRGNDRGMLKVIDALEKRSRCNCQRSESCALLLTAVVVVNNAYAIKARGPDPACLGFHKERATCASTCSHLPHPLSRTLRPITSCPATILHIYPSLWRSFDGAVVARPGESNVARLYYFYIGRKVKEGVRMNAIARAMREIIFTLRGDFSALLSKIDFELVDHKTVQVSRSPLNTEDFLLVWWSLPRGVTRLVRQVRVGEFRVRQVDQTSGRK